MIHIYNEILVIKRNKFESVELWYTNLEFVVQHEVSQKKKNKHCILKHTCGINKDDTDEHICRAGLEMQT